MKLITSILFASAIVARGAGLVNPSLSGVIANPNGVYNPGNGGSLTNVNLRPWNPDDIYSKQARNTMSQLYSNKVITVMYIGDVGGSIGGIMAETIYKSLNPYLDRQGFAIGDTASALGNYAYVTGSGTITVYDGSSESSWPGNHYGMGNGASLTWASTVTSIGYPANQIGLVWINNAGFGTIALQTNRNGGAYGTALTINGTAGNATNFTLPRFPDYGYKIVSTGSNLVVGAVLRDTTGPGWAVCTLVQGNIDVHGAWAALDTNLFYRAMSLIKPDLVLWEGDDDANSVSNNIATLDARWRAACPNSDIIYCTPTPCLQEPQYSILAAQRNAMIYYGKVYNRPVFDCFAYFNPTNDWITRGWYSDVTHVTFPGGFLETERLPEFAGISPKDMQTYGYTLKARGVSFVNSGETNFLSIGTASQIARLTILDTINGSGSDFLHFGSLFNGTVGIGRGSTFDFNNSIVWANSTATVLNVPSSGTVFFEQGQNTPMGQFMSSKGLAVSTSFSPVDPGAGGISAAANIISSVGFVGNLNTATNLGGTFLQTNWISGQVYTNTAQADIWVQCSVSMVTASVAGACRVSLQSGVNIAGLAHLSGVGGQTIVGSLAETETNWLGGFIASGNVFTFTNNVTGVGNSAVIISGTGQRKQF